MNGGPQCRVASPRSGSSTFTTRAPASPSIWVHNGPARTREKSATRMPSRGSRFTGTAASGRRARRGGARGGGAASPVLLFRGVELGEGAAEDADPLVALGAVDAHLGVAVGHG